MTLRHIRIDGDVAYVPLTKGFEAVIDTADVPLVGNYNWCAQVCREHVYAIRMSPRDPVTKKQTLIIMHRVLTDAPVGMDVDHRDRDGLNNRRSNLRVCTKSQNAFNRKRMSTNTSGVKGVSLDRASGKWTAYVCVDGVNSIVGRFKTLAEAKAARSGAAAMMHREFARDV